MRPSTNTRLCGCKCLVEKTESNAYDCMYLQHHQLQKPLGSGKPSPAVVSLSATLLPPWLARKSHGSIIGEQPILSPGIAYVLPQRRITRHRSPLRAVVSYEEPSVPFSYSRTLLTLFFSRLVDRCLLGSISRARRPV
jgi:hypothetical protein